MNEEETYTKLLSGYNPSSFQDFESHLKTEVGAVEDDIRLVLSEIFLNFIIQEILSGICSSENLSETLSWDPQKGHGSNRSIDIEYGDTSIKFIWW